MLRKERIDAMQAYISEVKTASMKELEDKFSIAPSTLRRDLATLIANGTVKKSMVGSQPLPIAQRTIRSPFTASVN